MEYRTVSTKLPIDELTLLRAYCEKKGVSPAHLIRELVLKEMRITVPHAIAGRNRIDYDRNKDSFIWSVELDNGKNVEVLRNVSPAFLENLNRIIALSTRERSSFLRKKREDSIPVPSDILRRKEL